eukprot:COSAG02_NODE_753_length_17610_cov_23.119753_15_plen_989_part_00
MATAARDSLEHVLVAEMSQLEEQRARLSAQLRQAEVELASSSLRCTELQTECMGFQSEFVGMSRDHEQLSVAHERLTDECQQQAEQLQQMVSECEAMRASVLQAHAATATELSVSKVMEQLQDELCRLQCALGDSDEVAATGSSLVASSAVSTDTYSREEELSALRSEREKLQSDLLQSEDEHTHDIERLESQHAAALAAQREESVAVIAQLSAEHSRVVKHLQEDAAYATAISAGGSAGDCADDESAELTRRHREALRALQAEHDVEMARLREEHAEQLARHVEELEAVSFLVEVPLVKSLTASELRDVAATMASEYYEDENIVEEGEVGDSMYVIQSGTAVVEKDGRPVATYGPRDFFGERVLVMSGSLDVGAGGGTAARAATVRADGPVQCFRLGQGPAESLMQRYGHIKEAFEARSRQYEEEDYANSVKRKSNSGKDGTSVTPVNRQHASLLGTHRGVDAARQMEPTTVSTTMMAILVDAICTLSRATARGLQLAKIERSYNILREEFESLGAAYKLKHQEETTLQSHLVAMAAEKAEALAAKSASAEALRTVSGGYQANIEASSVELRSTKVAHETLQAKHTELTVELRAATSKLEEAQDVISRVLVEKSQDAAAAAEVAAQSAEALELERARVKELEANFTHTKQRLDTLQDRFRQLEQEEAATTRALRVVKQLLTRIDAGHVFEQFDSNGDGRVTRAELRAGCLQMGLWPLLCSSKGQAESVEGQQDLGVAADKTTPVLDETDENAVTMTIDSIVRLADADGDGTIDAAEFTRLGQMKQELDRVCDQMATAQHEAESKLSLLAQESQQHVAELRQASEAELANANAKLAAALVDRDSALERTVMLEEQLASSVKKGSALEASLAASREQLAGMYNAVETQHRGVAQLKEQLNHAENNMKHTQTMLDTSVQRAEEQRARFKVEVDSLRQELSRVTEEAHLSEVALTAAMDVVEQCRTKVSPADWSTITGATQPQLQQHPNSA